jgi:hypothetical protein
LTRPFNIIAVSLLTFCIGLFPATGPRAAEFRVFQYAQDYDDGPGAYIVMVGETVTGDTDRFLDALPRAIALHGSEEFPIDLWLEGPGGDLDEALKLGQLVYDLGFATLVDEGAECASACALIWLGGARLYAHERARIGFHQAWEGDGVASVAGNAEVGFYLSQVGLERATVQYVVSADPDSMTWLNRSIADTIDLPVTFLD